MALIDKEQIRKEIERIRSEAVMASFGNETYWLRSRVATCVDILAFLDTLPDEPKPMSFTPVLRLLNMLEPSKKAASYATKFADTLEKEGYQKDASLVRNQIKIWNGEDVAMATMDEKDRIDEGFTKFMNKH